MNRINNLFDEQYILDLFKKEVLNHYPNFTAIKKVKIIPIKKFIWETTYHVVIEFKTTFIRNDGKRKKLSLYCSAHSSEPRKNSFEALSFLWNNNFSRSRLTIPHPLFYSAYFNAFFYRGVQGNNLYHFIRDNNFKEIELIIPKAAAWFAKLHCLNTKNAKNFNPENSRIETVVPGKQHILTKIKEIYPAYLPIYEKIYNIINEKEKKFFTENLRRWLIHGDAHPENIIKISKNKIAVIDFTDVCLADFARDLGSFLQQLEFMATRKIGDLTYIEKIKKLFLDSYSINSKIKLDDLLLARIKNYYLYTSLRTASFFLLNDQPEPERGFELLNKICQELRITNKLIN